MADEKTSTVTVACRHSNGVVLQLYEPYTDLYGYSVMRQVGASVTLKGPGSISEGGGGVAQHGESTFHNEGVDAAFFEAWLKQNEKNALVVDGMISLVKDEERAEPERVPE
jgi:hypothetical protein